MEPSKRLQARAEIVRILTASVGYQRAADDYETRDEARDLMTDALNDWYKLAPKSDTPKEA